MRRAAGGPARLRVIILLAAVFALDGADKSTVAVNAGKIEQTFGVGHAAIGLLVTVTTLVGAVFTLPAGILTDRVNRTRLLGGSIVLWAVATVLSGMAPSYVWLLASRGLLGAVTATAGPAVAALMGDYFPAGERARIFGFVLAGELLGTGVGYLASNLVTALLSWRFSLAWLAAPALLLAWLMWRLPEPARDGRDQLVAGQRRVQPAHDREPPQEVEVSGDGTQAGHQNLAFRATEAAHVPPRQGMVLRQAPGKLPLRRAFGYVLRVRTVLLMIVASALGYFFLAGVRVFAMLFVTSHYGVGRFGASVLLLVVGVGALLGVLTGGRVADRLLERGRVNARVLVATVCLLAVPVALAPALTTTTVLLAAPLLAVGGALLTAVNPPLDAARLDVIPPGLWGRAESIRTLVRMIGESSAPSLFGLLAGAVFTGDSGLRYTFLVSLAPLTCAGLLGLVAMRTYPRDVATADASARPES